MICEDSYPRTDLWHPLVDDVIKILDYRHTVDKNDVHLYQTVNNKSVCMHCGKGSNYPLHHNLEMLASLLGTQGKAIEQINRELHPTLSLEAEPVPYIKRKLGIRHKIEPSNREGLGILVSLVGFCSFVVGAGVMTIIGAAVWGW